MRTMCSREIFTKKCRQQQIVTVIRQYYSQNLFRQKQAFDPAGYVSKDLHKEGEVRRFSFTLLLT